MNNFPCKIIEADLAADIVTLQMEGDYTVSAGQKFLCDAAPLSAEPAAEPACPFQCGWKGLHKIAVQDAAYLAKMQWPEDEEGVSVPRATVMRSMDYLIQVCRAMLNAAPVAAQPDLTQQTLDDVMAGIPARDAEIAALRKEIDSLRAQPPVSGANGLPVELSGVAQEIAGGSGFWRSCSGCHELNEGHDTGPQSKVFQCALGNGCSECGGIGAIWDTTDYDAMGDALAAGMAQPQPSGNAGELDERAAFERFSSKNGLNTPKADDLHRSHLVAWMWKAWRARAALAQQQAIGPGAAPRNSEILDLAISEGMTTKDGMYCGSAATILCFAGALIRGAALDKQDADKVDALNEAYQRGLRDGRREGDDFIKGCLA